ncbi:hypothetical protein LWI29_030710 [Acer saccharum]|uniref:IBB domain-containing protein n=1 Tax=Acer saccharum TaxID=4024 RepID=A0AA39W0E4_ACESA|nr:hypothetical protein LWI29_030710 [Acer saccharum]
MAEVHQKYDFIDPYDPMWDRSPFKAKSDLPKHQYFAEYANQLRDTEGFHVDLIPIAACSRWILPRDVNSPMTIEAAEAAIKEFNTLKGANLKLRQILSSNCMLLESVLYFLTFQCSDNSFYEAKIYLHDSGYQLVKFRSAKFWPSDQTMSMRPSTMMEVRQNCYEVAVDADEGRRRREDNTVVIRKSKREESLMKKRREGLQQQQQLPASAQLELLPKMEAGIISADHNEQLWAITQFRMLLSAECSPPIEEVIQSGVVPCFVYFLRSDDSPRLQFEAAWVLTNIASGTIENIRVLLAHNAVSKLAKLLVSPSDDVCEQAMWALINIASESPRCRDLVLGCGALHLLQEQLKKHDKLPMLRNATWTLSIFCRGKPQPPFYLVKYAFPALAQLTLLNDEEVLTDVCWALSYLSDGTNDEIQAVIDAGVCPRLVEFLTHPSPFPSVLIPALRTVGNIVTGDDLQTQCIISHKALPCLLNLLTNNYKKSIMKEACWTISNITAGNKEQIHAVIEAKIIGPLVHLLQNAEFDVKKEAAWAISNATYGGTHEQIKYLVSQGCIKPLCDLLICPDPRIVTVCLEGLENILKAGESDKSLGNTGGVNVCAQMIDDAEGLEKIENLQSHDNTEISEKAMKILETYWLDVLFIFMVFLDYCSLSIAHG